MVTNEHGLTKSANSNTLDVLSHTADKELLNNKPNAQFIGILKVIEVPENHTVVFGDDKRGEIVETHGAKLLNHSKAKWLHKCVGERFYCGHVYAIPNETPKDRKRKELRERYVNASKILQEIKEEIEKLEE